MSSVRGGLHVDLKALGFSRFNLKSAKDANYRFAFRQNELNQRLSQYAFAVMGCRMDLRPLIAQTGKGRVRDLCIEFGYTKPNDLTYMFRSPMTQAAEEGWFKKYGYDSKVYR